MKNKYSFPQTLSKKKVVVTAGPTRENIDPVRYIGNYSSGKMGYALAISSRDAGADVVLISGPTNLPCPAKISLISVKAAEEMYAAVMREISNCDIFIAAAAVSDYRPVKISPQKIKKNDGVFHLELQRNPDILRAVSLLVKKPFTVGFAAETENLLENARKKMIDKDLDIIVANSVGENLGFDSDENEVVILQKNQPPIALPKTKKIALAKTIIKIVASTFNKTEI